jgi:hypothetical protein
LNIISISIADFKIRIQSEDEGIIVLEDSYAGFIINNSTDYDILINGIYGFPKELLDFSDLLFEASDSKHKYFSIHNHQNGLKFFVYNQNSNKIQQIAVLNSDYTKWTIYVDKNVNENNSSLLSYPMGPLVFYYLTVKYNAIMIHASGIYDGLKGRIFSGVSGVGKTTMAFLWQKAGSLIINDDRLIIRKEEDKYYIYNTPMFYFDVYKKVKLDSVFLIKHAAKNEVKKNSGITAVSKLMAFCIQHGYNLNIIEHHMEFISQLCSEISIFEVGFLPNNSIVNYIQSNGI